MPLSKPRLPQRRGRWAATLALLVAVAVVVAILVSNHATPAHNTDAGTTATGAATVQRRNLVATDTESGTLSYANSQTVYNRLSGTITWVPKVGQVIRPGHTLFEVDNKPVLLMDGSTPAYRDLSSSDVKGPDVYELNENLVDLGYDPDGIVVDDEWQAATTAGIDRMQYDLGETQTGKLTLGQVVFLPGPQMIQTVTATVGSAASYTPAVGSLGSEFVDYPSSTPHAAGTTGTDTSATGTSSTGTTGTTTTGTTPPAAPNPGTTTTGTTTTSATGTTTSGVTSPTRPTTTPTRTNTTPTTDGHGHPSPSNGSDNLSQRTLQQLLRLVQEQQRQIQAEERASHSPGSPGSSSGHNPSSGSGSHNGTGSSGSTGNNGGGGGAGATEVMTTSSTKLVVTVDLSASSQSEATIGEHVTVEMPDGSTVGGHVTAVSPVAQSSSSGDNGTGGDTSGGSSGSSTVPVTVVLDKHARGGGLDQASVSVNFVQSKARHVLSVPVTALLATSGSSFAVQEANGQHRLIPVTTGLFAAGYVEISGQGIHPGLQVTDSQG